MRGKVFAIHSVCPMMVHLIKGAKDVVFKNVYFPKK